MATIAGADLGDSKTDEFTPKSSFLESVKFDRKANTLDITFKSGSMRRYISVFPSTYESFRQSPDHGSFFARAIKGQLSSAPIVNKDIGRQRTTALKKVT